MKIVILGIGNTLLKDEGVGVHAIRAIEERYSFSPKIEIIDGGTMGRELLPFIEGKDKVLIIDAVDFKEKAGTVRTIEHNDIPALLQTKFSVHQIGIPDMIYAAKFMGIAPREMCLIGIQPKEICTGLEMSHEIKDKFQDLIDAVCDKLNTFGVEIKKKEHVPCNSI